MAQKIFVKEVENVMTNGCLNYVHIHLAGTNGKTYLVSMSIAELMAISETVTQNVMHSINQIDEEDGNEG